MRSGMSTAVDSNICNLTADGMHYCITIAAVVVWTCHSVALYVHCLLCVCVYIYHAWTVGVTSQKYLLYIYRLSQEECARLREGALSYNNRRR